jgi:hypothetical protein
MEQKPSFVEPYKPSMLHRFYAWVDRLPGPYWLYYILLLVFAGLLNHIVGWNENAIPEGEINWYYALTALYLCYWLFESDFLFRVIRNAIVEFLPLLDISEDDHEKFVYEFTHLPARPTGIAFFIGMCIGLGISISIFPTAIEMNNAFPELEIPIFTFTFGMGWLTLYMVIRTYVLINRTFDVLKNINIYNLNSLYALSRIPIWLMVFIILGIYMLFGMNPSLVDFSFLFMILIISVWVVVVFSLLWFPLKRANRILVLEKRRLLNDINLHIESTFDLLHTRIAQKDLRQIGEIREAIQSLMIEKEFVGAFRTWPWNPGTFRGVLTLVLAPLLLDLFVMLLSKLISS